MSAVASTERDRFRAKSDNSVDGFTRERAARQVDEVQAALLDFRAAARACAERIKAANPKFLRDDAARIVECAEEVMTDALDAGAIEEARKLARGRAY
ncbi:MAG: hypothetical protein KJZ75_11435 [Hyphomonadaceae bacterium]|nr:hypothetical protein [Hyphomonadaceae bacterium]